MVPSNPNGNGENSASMMGISTADAPQDTAVSSGISFFFHLLPFVTFKFFVYTYSTLFIFK